MSSDFGDRPKFPGELSEYAPPPSEDESHDSWAERIQSAWPTYLGLLIAGLSSIALILIAFQHPVVLWALVMPVVLALSLRSHIRTSRMLIGRHPKSGEKWGPGDEL